MRSAKNPSTSHSRPGATDARTEDRYSLSDSSSTCSIRGLRKNVVEARGQDRCHGVDHLDALLLVGHEDLEPQLLHAARQHTHRRDLRVVDVDNLAVQRPQPRVAEEESSTTPCSSCMRMWIVSPTEYQRSMNIARPAMMSISTAAPAKPTRIRTKDAPAIAVQAIDTADQLADGEHGCSSEAEVGDGGAHDRDLGLAPLETGHLPGLREVVISRAPVVPDQHLERDERRRPSEQPAAAKRRMIVEMRADHRLPRQATDGPCTP